MYTVSIFKNSWNGYRQAGQFYPQHGGQDGQNEFLQDAGHNVIGVDQSEGMLAKAKEHFPEVRYIKMALHEMKFREMFDGVICMDAMEHICPEDYPGILHGFQVALKPGGVLYLRRIGRGTRFRFEGILRVRKTSGLPIVFGEVADKAAFKQAMEQTDVSDEFTDRAVYHYYPPLEKVREWIDQAGLKLRRKHRQRVDPPFRGEEE